MADNGVVAGGGLTDWGSLGVVASFVPRAAVGDAVRGEGEGLGGGEGAVLGGGGAGGGGADRRGVPGAVAADGDRRLRVGRPRHERERRRVRFFRRRG